MISYRTVISCKFPVETVLENGEIVTTEELKYFPIDYMNDREVTANSHVATQPMQRGDYMADHMYRDPVQVTISGKFSLNGRNLNNKSYSFMSTNNRLSDVQKTFEVIKNKGLLCDIFTIATDVDTQDPRDTDRYNANNTRFISRSSMALESIRWTEQVNTLGFSFGFKEVITVDEVEYDVDTSDIYYPNVEGPVEASFGTLLMDTGKLPEIIVRALYDKGLIQKKWAKWVVESINSGNIGSKYIAYDSMTVAYAKLNAVIAMTIASCVGMVIAIKIAVAVGGTVASVFPVGTIMVGVVAVAATIGAAIYTIFKRVKNKNLAKKMFKNGEADLERLADTCADVEAAMNVAKLDMKVIEIQSDDDQEICLSIGGDYFYISFTKIAVEPYFEVQISCSNKRWSQDKIKNPGMPYVTSLDEMKDETREWFENASAENKYRIYLMNVNVNDDILKNNAEEKINVLKTLSSYQIWILKGNAKKAIKQMEDTIVSATLESLKKQD